MSDIDSKNQGVYYDAGQQTLHIRDVQISDAAVLAEIPRWTSGTRGPVADDDIVLAADYTPFVVTGLSTFSRIVPLVSDDQSVRTLEAAVTDLGRQTAEAVNLAAETTREAAQRSQKEMATATEATVKVVHDTAKQMREEARATVSGMVTDLTKLVAGDDSPTARHVQAAVGAAGEKLSLALEERINRTISEIERKFDLRDATSPMGQLATVVQEELKKSVQATAAGQEQITVKVEALSQAVAEATAVANATAKTTAVTPLKGRPFESAVHDVLDSLAGEMGDTYEDTGDQVGLLSRCKKGDGLLTVGAIGDAESAARLLIEMHNADSGSRNWPAYLDEAERNRGALVSLGIVRTAEQVPGGAGIRIWGSRRIVLAFDPEVDDPALLRTVVLLLRAQASLAASRRSSDQVQTAEVELREALDQIGQLLEMQKTAGRIRENADKLASSLTSIHDKVVRSIETAMGALHGAAEDSAAA